MPLQNSIDVPANALNSKLTYVPSFNQLPVMSLSTGGAAAVTQGDVNVWAFPKYGAYFECFNNVATSVIGPTLSTTAGHGLNIGALIAANSKFVEINEGSSVSANNLFVTGTSAPFYVQATFIIPTLANLTDVNVGFRIQAANQVTVVGASGYSAYAMMGVHGTSGLIESQTQLAAGGNTVTSTTQSATAATAFTIRVNVDGSGNVTYLLNGSTPTSVAAFQFASSTSVIPFMIFTAASGANGEVDLVSYQCGFQ